ncbi:MAG: protein-L-isoaspartate(D-aspartate) O-methyltransferase [candidate division NC10 bacterium]|nr:protein-L-isoaspartate(D-aspartate) O-methyltransferase [candidate division NC10 bacterium]
MRSKGPVCVGIVLLLAIPLIARAVEDSRFEKARREMVERQLKARDITDPSVLRAMGEVPRHLFIDRGSWSKAYDDRPLPIGEGQTISQPYIVALMTQLLRLKGGEKVLEVGTGSGYHAAVLSKLVDKVYTVEIIRSLGEKAKDRFRTLGYKNVEVKLGDGYYGWKEHAPFDAIVVTAAANHLPPPLLDQLKDGGRMSIPVGAPFYVQTLMLVEKQKGRIITNHITQVLFVPLLGGH